VIGVGAVENEPRGDVTEILAHAGELDQSALSNRLLPVVYAELHRMADARLRRERPDHTLRPTELVHEAYLKLVDQSRVHWNGRAHFMAIASTAMRRILVDHARGRARIKRGGGVSPVTLNDEMQGVVGSELGPEDLIVLDDALATLSREDPRQARIVELRAFSGLTVAEVAALLEVSKRTVEGDWAHALAWLRRHLAEGGPG